MSDIKLMYVLPDYDSVGIETHRVCYFVINNSKKHIVHLVGCENIIY